MDISNRLPDPIQWSEGMLLTPQHLQQNDIYWQEQLRHTLACVQPNYWGLVDLAINGADLVAGKLTIERLHCVMPDGLALQYPRESDEPLRLDLNALKWEEGKSRKVHLAVPLRAEGAASRRSQIQRYRSIPGALEVDENTGDDRVEIGRLRARAELRPTEAVGAKYTSFPLLELRREQSGAFALTQFHPPLLRLSASAFLGAELGLQGWLSGLVRHARERAKELSAETDAADAGDERAHTDLRLRRFAVQHATKSLPPLELLVRSPSVHPFDLYLGLAQLVGQIGALGEDPVPPPLEPYRHDDCLPGFRAALEFVEMRLDQMSLAFEWLPFEQAKDGCFSRALPADLPLSALIVELRPRPGQGASEVAGWLRQARIGSDDLMPLLERRRLPGALHEAVRPNQVPGLSLRPGRAVFSLANHEMDIGTGRVPMFRHGRPLWIQGPADAHAPLAITLYRPRPRPAGKLARAA